MNSVINAVQSVLSILVMISIGYVLTWKGWFDQGTSKLFSRLVVHIALPALMLSNITSTFTKDTLTQSGFGIFIPFLVILLSFCISMLFSRVLRIPKNRLGLFQTMFAFSNTIFIGLPVNLALFGEDSILYVLFYYIANTTLFWTIGVYSIRQDGNDIKESLFSTNTVKRIFSPPLIAFLIAVGLVMLQIPLPKFIADSVRYVGNMTTPISMLFIGIVIHSIGFKDIRLEKGMIPLLIGRFAITPMLVFVFIYFIPIPDLMKKVFVIQSALPVMTQTAIVAEAYGSDHRFGAVMATVSTLLSLITLPFYMFLLG